MNNGQLINAINCAPLGYAYITNGIISEINNYSKDVLTLKVKTPIAQYFLNEHEYNEFINCLILNKNVLNKKTTFCLLNNSSANCTVIINAQLCEPFNEQAYIMWVNHEYTDSSIEKYKNEISKQNHELQILIDTIPHPIFCKDANSNFTRVNKAYSDVFKIDAENLIGKNVLELKYLDMADRIRYHSSSEKIIKNCGQENYEISMPFADGKMHETLYSTTGFKLEDGSPGGLIGIFIDIADIREAEREIENAKKEIETSHNTIMESLAYSRKIQRSLLPDENIFANVFSDYSIIWKPKDIVGGDIYWVKQFNEGTVLCMCDCTGHGTPGALLTMIVASIFDMCINDSNCSFPNKIIWELETKLTKILNVTSEDSSVHFPQTNITDIKDGCDLAVLFIAKDGSVKFSSGNTNIFVCNGADVTRYKGQRFHVGEGILTSADEIKTWLVPANKENKFYIASDGLYGQLGNNNSCPFGYKKFQKIILDNHNEKQCTISNNIWNEFKIHCGETPQFDDFQLISFQVKT